ncbi:dnaJ, partial [Symbiodinium sp. CCMP2456]
MATRSLYEILEVERYATMDQIKCAFKRLALQVHPDKGGSKDSFHQAYQAFEILADPAARAKYDMKQTGGPTCKSAEVSTKRPGRSTSSGKCKKQETGQATCQPHADERKESGSRRPPQTASRRTGNAASSLPKVCALLKNLTPELRLLVIRDEFTQQQRMQLEKWMVDQPSQNVPKALVSSTPPASESQAPPSRRMKQAQLALQDSCSTGCGSSGGRELHQGPAAQPSSSFQQRQTVTSGIYTKQIRSRTAFLYSAGVRIDNVRTRTRITDLPTALEHLVILTAMKQRMSQVGTENDYASRLQQAAESSAAEHGRSVDELGLRYQVCHTHGFFLGKSNLVPCPWVRSATDLAEQRERLCRLRWVEKKKPSLGRNSKLWEHGLAHLEQQWQQLQQVVAWMWESQGLSSENALKILRSRHELSAGNRERQLRYWESHHMALHDKPCYLAAHMRRFHRPRPVRPKQTHSELMLCRLRALLRTWRRQIQQEEKRAQKCAQKEKRRRALERLEKQRRARKEARDKRREVRSRAFVPRQKGRFVDLTMDDILGTGPCRKRIISSCHVPVAALGALEAPRVEALKVLRRRAIEQQRRLVVVFASQKLLEAIAAIIGADCSGKVASKAEVVAVAALTPPMKCEQLLRRSATALVHETALIFHGKVATIEQSAEIVAAWEVRNLMKKSLVVAYHKLLLDAVRSLVHFRLEPQVLPTPAARSAAEGVAAAAAGPCPVPILAAEAEVGCQGTAAETKTAPEGPAEHDKYSAVAEECRPSVIVGAHLLGMQDLLRDLEARGLRLLEREVLADTAPDLILGPRFGVFLRSLHVISSQQQELCERLQQSFTSFDEVLLILVSELDSPQDSSWKDFAASLQRAGRGRALRTSLVHPEGLVNLIVQEAVRAMHSGRGLAASLKESEDDELSFVASLPGLNVALAEAAGAAWKRGARALAEAAGLQLPAAVMEELQAAIQAKLQKSSGVDGGSGFLQRGLPDFIAAA